MTEHGAAPSARVMTRGDQLHEVRAALLRRRRKLGLSQRDVAELMGRRSRSAVGKLEGGEAGPKSVTVELLVRWIEALDAHVRIDILNGVVTVTHVGDASG